MLSLQCFVLCSVIVGCSWLSLVVVARSRLFICLVSCHWLLFFVVSRLPVVVGGHDYSGVGLLYVLFVVYPVGYLLSLVLLLGGARCPWLMLMVVCCWLLLLVVDVSW